MAGSNITLTDTLCQVVLDATLHQEKVTTFANAYVQHHSSDSLLLSPLFTFRFLILRNLCSTCAHRELVSVPAASSCYRKRVKGHCRTCMRTSVEHGIKEMVYNAFHLTLPFVARQHRSDVLNRPTTSSSCVRSY